MHGVDGWGPKELGFWALLVDTPGDYSISLHWPEGEALGAGHCTVQIGNMTQETDLAAGETSFEFPRITLGKGPVRLDAKLETKDGARRPSWLLVARTVQKGA